jgi:hypothetical protein
MKRSWLLVACWTVSLVVVSQVSALGQAPPKPGPQHEMLKDGEGTWDAVAKGPEEGPPMKGSATAKMVCGGLWLASEFKMDFGGQQFEGRGLDGYDLDKKKFVSVWIDSMSTAPILFEGDYDQASKTMTMTGQGKGPDGKPAKFKSIFKVRDKDHQTFQMFVAGPDGKDNLMMTIEYSRKK